MYCTKESISFIILFLTYVRRRFSAVICNGNRTEWSTIQGVIGRVISNRPSA